MPICRYVLLNVQNTIQGPLKQQYINTFWLKGDEICEQSAVTMLLHCYVYLNVQNAIQGPLQQQYTSDYYHYLYVLARALC